MLSRRPADHSLVLPSDDLIEKELMRSRFLRLTSDLIRGEVARTTFDPWEVEFLLDVATCSVEPKHRTETLRQYQKAVERQLDYGPGPPMKLSDFLQQRKTRRP
jgi:hypothetical protein